MMLPLREIPISAPLPLAPDTWAIKIRGQQKAGVPGFFSGLFDSRMRSGHCHRSGG
jgi:hypothetical protein